MTPQDKALNKKVLTVKRKKIILTRKPQSKPRVSITKMA